MRYDETEHGIAIRWGIYFVGFTCATVAVALNKIVRVQKAVAQCHSKIGATCQHKLKRENTIRDTVCRTDYELRHPFNPPGRKKSIISPIEIA